MSLLKIKEHVPSVGRRKMVQCYRHVLRRNIVAVLSKASGLGMKGARGRRGPRKTWEKCVEDERRLVVLRKVAAVGRLG